MMVTVRGRVSGVGVGVCACADASTSAMKLSRTGNVARFFINPKTPRVALILSETPLRFARAAFGCQHLLWYEPLIPHIKRKILTLEVAKVKTLESAKNPLLCALQRLSLRALCV